MTYIEFSISDSNKWAKYGYLISIVICDSHIFNEFILIYSYCKNANICSINTPEHEFISTDASHSNLVDDKEL